MPDPITSTYDRVEVIASVQRRRRWSTEEKVRIVEETNLPGNTVSLVARRHGIVGNQLFTWRRLMAQGALTAAGAGEEVVPASELRAAHQQIRELGRPFGAQAIRCRSSAGATTGSAGSRGMRTCWPRSPTGQNRPNVINRESAPGLSARIGTA